MSDIKKASVALGITEQAVRWLMENGQLAIGYVIQHRKRKRYIVVDELLEKEVKRRNE